MKSKTNSTILLNLTRIVQKYVTEHRLESCLDELTTWALVSFDEHGNEVPELPTKENDEIES